MQTQGPGFDSQSCILTFFSLKMEETDTSMNICWAEIKRDLEISCKCKWGERGAGDMEKRVSQFKWRPIGEVFYLDYALWWFKSSIFLQKCGRRSREIINLSLTWTAAWEYFKWVPCFQKGTLIKNIFSQSSLLSPSGSTCYDNHACTDNATNNQ